MVDEISPLLQPLAAALHDLDTLPNGLSQAEAARRLRANGANLLIVHKERPVILQFLARFKNPLVLLLLLARCRSASGCHLRCRRLLGRRRRVVRVLGVMTVLVVVGATLGAMTGGSDSAQPAVA